MNARPKRLPRLWCAMQGLLPLDACLAAQRGELAWPPEPTPPVEQAAPAEKRIRVAAEGANVNVRRRGPVRTQS
jgi:hypothetical protein